MKKNDLKQRHRRCPVLRKMLNIMKVTTLLFFLALLQVSANSYSQTRLSLKFEKEKLENVFSQIEANSEFSIFYKNALIQNSKAVSGNFENALIFEILDQVLNAENLTYTVKNKLIMIVPKDEAKTETAGQQQKTVIGKVTDSTGGGLPGVSVVLKGTTTGTITDFDGNYSLPNVPANAILQFSFVGMKSQEIAVASKTTINVSLADESIGIEEVVAVGYGTQKKVNLTGSIATVDKKILENRPITNSTLALQGATGVYVNQASGRPGADNGTIRIRGIGTLSDSNPLVLVDGIEYDLRDVNPSDIESISVLKDAASSAIYGNRAANGVILVKTKTGQKGSLKVDYSMYLGSQSIMQVPPDIVTNSVEYMEGKNRALANEGKPIEYAQTLIDEYKAGVAAGTDPWKYANTNWMDVMFKNAPIQEHNLRFSGGSEKTTFSASLGYLDQDGILLNTYAKKYNINLNLSSEVNKSVKIGASLMSNYTLNTESGYTTNDANGEGGLMGLIYRGLPMQAPIAKDGTYADQWVRVPGHNFFRNPYALAYEGFHTNKSQRTLASVNVEFKLPFNITYKVTGSAKHI